MADDTTAEQAAETEAAEATAAKQKAENTTGEVDRAAADETAAATTDSGVKVVVVQAPVPPKKRGNRVVGVLLALLGAVIFAVAYAAVAALVYAIAASSITYAPVYSQFLSSAVFWVPVLFFAIGFILLVLILNRAGWWLHVLGSLLVAVIVYFGSIGLLMLIGFGGQSGVLAGGNGSALFSAIALAPLILIATVVAREAAVWIGLAIAARGRRVKAKNAERLAQFHADLEAKKAEHEHPAPQAV